MCSVYAYHDFDVWVGEEEVQMVDDPGHDLQVDVVHVRVVYLCYDKDAIVEVNVIAEGSSCSTLQSVSRPNGFNLFK